MQNRPKPLATPLLLLMMAACGGVDSENDDEMEAPRIVSVSPSDGEHGVYADTEVVITFSEEMDPATVEAALETSQLGSVSRSWNEESNVLTLTPLQPLEYAEGMGNDPTEFARKTYSLSIGSGATDVAGNPLYSAREVTFQTYLAMQTIAPRIDSLTNSAASNSGPILGADSYIGVGDSAEFGEVRGFMSFDLSAIPDEAEDIELAVISTSLETTSGNPWQDLGASIIADHVTYLAMDSAGFNAVPFRNFIDFSMEGVSEVNSAVTEAVAEDLENRNIRFDRSQFRLRFVGGTDGDGVDDFAAYSREPLELMLVYLVP